MRVHPWNSWPGNGVELGGAPERAVKTAKSGLTPSAPPRSALLRSAWPGKHLALGGEEMLLGDMNKPSIPAVVLTELNRQANHEFAAAHGYTAIAAWCEAEALPGCAAFFRRQAAEEREHADKIMSHLLDRGVTPEFAAVPAPRQDFGSLLEVAQEALAKEQANTRGIHAVYEAALAAKDYPAQVLMHWFINEQVEEEKWANDLVTLVRNSSCAGSLASLDRHVSSLLGADKSGD